jgi:hypothetical protein
MPTKLKIEWLRLSQGSTKHAVLPAELLGYVSEFAFRGGDLIPKRRLTLCGRTGEPNMVPYYAPVHGGRMIDPARFKKCDACLGVLAEVTFTSTPSVVQTLNKKWKAIAKKKAEARHKLRVKEFRTRPVKRMPQTRIFAMTAQVKEDGYLGDRTVAG